MTTILADWNLGVMVADSMLSDDDRQWKVKKVHRINGALLGFCGSVDVAMEFFEWYRKGCVDKPPTSIKQCDVLVLCKEGLYHYQESKVPLKVEDGIEAIGTGAKAAIVGYELLGFKNPQRVVRVVCEHDASSKRPVRTYKL